MVKTLPFGSSGLKVNSPGFGAMGLSFGLGTNLTFKQAEPVLLKAIEPGCTFWDTAVVYAAGVNESLSSQPSIPKHNLRDQIFSSPPRCGFAVFEKRRSYEFCRTYQEIY
jgi:aryl-alcohol dehydrogenase-like predicted oxidoreductase